jgi:hypothetical protein
MWRVLATHWEAETYTECWCTDKEQAERIANLLKKEYFDTTVQVDPPKEK